MSVPIIENWTDIVGEISSQVQPSDLSGFVVVVVSVSQIDSVEGFANLLADAIGTDLELLIPEDVAESLELTPGATIVCRVRRAGLTRIFVHPEHVQVQNS